MAAYRCFENLPQVEAIIGFCNIRNFMAATEAVADCLKLPGRESLPRALGVQCFSVHSGRVCA